MSEKVITISLDEVTKQFTIPDITATDLELNIWFSVVKEEWKKQQENAIKKEQSTTLAK